MNVVPPPLPGLHTRRCVRHSAREAAARCPECGGFFCRECVVEHAGRLLCAPCLARISHGADVRRIRWARCREALTAVAGVAVLWLVFYVAGALLLKIPSQVHDGSAWRRLSTHPHS